MDGHIHDCFRKRGGGYTLTEVLLTIMIIAILAGGTMLAVSRSSDNAEATVIMSDLDAAKNALLAYSMEHRTRTSDTLGDFIGKSSSVIISSLDNYLSSQVTTAGSKAKAHFDKIKVEVDTGPSGNVRIGFVEFPAEQGIINALRRKTSAAAMTSVAYDFNAAEPSIWLDVK
ncbi:MAG: type II secretion system GspH family protein [Synergistaceae bacterium]|jgi:prepilin-type N-terminal cleavage/methylation domain-containing protein|nr:type II secretion system GspH family protein [Synergistaceae bacterium]